MMKKKLLIINVTANTGSTGRIAEDIGRVALSCGYDSYFAYGRMARESKCQLIRIGNHWDVKLHVLQTRFLDNQCFASSQVTKKLIDEIEKIQPDIINIHNLHGYYLNIEILLSYLAKTNIPVVCTLHDCWMFTGHCAHFQDINCVKWKTLCYDCPKTRLYPKSFLFDASERNYLKKKKLFDNLNKLTIVTPSQWLADLVKESFLSMHPLHVIYNGVDTEIFKPCVEVSLKEKYQIKDDEKVILGVASVWTKNKGWNDFLKLSFELNDKIRIVLVGLNKKQMKMLPSNVIGIMRTENVKELSLLYSMADIFVNPTYLDNFPTTNIESLACGTPVITYKTGGSPEAIDKETGIVVQQGDIESLKNAIYSVLAKGKMYYADKCRLRAEKMYNKHECFASYINLFKTLMNEVH